MQKLLAKFSPLLLLLLLFSCAKDQDISPAEGKMELLQAKAKSSSEVTCDIPCQRPDYLNINDVTGCSALIEFGLETELCGTFVLRLQNLATGEITNYDPVTSPFVLGGLTPCTQYTLGVAHVTDQCRSSPLKMSFQTSCKSCKSCKGCDGNCKDPDYAYVENIGLTEATVKFGFSTKTCGYFIAQLKITRQELTPSSIRPPVH